MCNELPFGDTKTGASRCNPGGTKTVESRFTRTRRAYFGSVRPGDRLFLKLSSGPVCATACAARVKYFSDLTPPKVGKIRRQYNHLIKADDDYWQSKSNCPFGMLVWLRDIKPIRPLRINKKDWRAWVVLSEQQDFGLLRA
jgi:hypothetical protein